MNRISYQEKNAPAIVCIGGGTGLSTMLRGLKAYTPKITAIVTVTDDGGGSGVLRDELRMPPRAISETVFSPFQYGTDHGKAPVLPL
jgi:hypothetical protein